MSSVPPPSSPPPVTPSTAPYNNPPNPNREYRERNSYYSNSKGDAPPPDFGHRRNPDFDGDGKVSDAEARVYSAELRNENSRYTTDSRERVSLYKEDSKNYRAEVTARTEHIKSNNDNKMHKMFGKDTHYAPPMPFKPEPPRPE